MSQKSIYKTIQTPFDAIPKKLSFSLAIGVWVVVVGAWVWLTYSGAVKDMFLPKPGKVLQTTFQMASDGSLYEHMMTSLQVGNYWLCCIQCDLRPIGPHDGNLSCGSSFPGTRSSTLCAICL